jgi:hypothetical protein
MNVLRTFHNLDFREFPKWQSQSSQARQNSEHSHTSIESTSVFGFEKIKK